MRNSPFLLLAALLCFTKYEVNAQAISVVLPIDSVINWMERAPDGGYLGHQGIGPSVVKFDAAMQHQWSAYLGNVDVHPYTLTHFNSMPDGGAIAVGSAGMEFIGMDSILSKVFVARISATGDQVFAKYLYFQQSSFGIAGISPYSYFGNPITVDSQGESFVSLDDANTYSGDKILKLSSDGLPQWVTELPDNHMLVSELTPDEVGGCYFVSQAEAQHDNIEVGHVLSDGSLDWCNTYSRNNAYLFAKFHVKVAANGHVVVAGMEGNNLLWMELGAGGSVLQYRLVAQVPAVSFGVQDALRGFGQLTSGEWVGVHGNYLGTRLTFLDEDGTWSRSYNQPKELHGGWYDQLFWTGLSTHNSEFTVTGKFRRIEAVFNFTENRPTLTTFPGDPLGHCLVVLGNAAQTSIPPASISVPPMLGFLTPYAVPTVVDTIMQLTPGGDWPASDLCGLTTSIVSPEDANDAIRLLGNPVLRGEPIILEMDMRGTVTVLDLTGRAVTRELKVEPGRFEIPATGVASGIYLVSVLDTSGKQVFSKPVVLQ